MVETSVSKYATAIYTVKYNVAILCFSKHVIGTRTDDHFCLDLKKRGYITTDTPSTLYAMAERPVNCRFSFSMSQEAALA